ncbi:MAG: glycosyltransferase [Verrucomicrobiales bacterium]|nr:glycosyltransferase [Verrucomicrobiales bacterium]
MSTKPASRTPPPPLVSIIIPVFNKVELTMQCLAALAQVTRHVPHEVIVVDNASTDATPRRLRDQAPHVRHLRNETNRNFAGACNQGAASASGKYLVFLNNDTVPLEGWLDALLEEARSHPEVALVGSRLLYENGLIQHAGIAFARETRSPFHPYRLLRADDPRVNRRRELQAVTAACILMRPRWFQDCGGFSEDYRNGYEDLDLCLRVRQRGGVIVYQPKSALFHLESQTPGRMRHDNDNRALFFQRWNDAVLSDEDAYYFDDGYALTGHREGNSENPTLRRISTDDERARWKQVAEAQRFAAARRRADTVACLTRHDAWPEDGPVRAWAGALASKLGLPEIARAHFEASLEHQENPELRLLLSLISPGNQRGAAVARWETSAKGAFHALRRGQFTAAQTAFETALLRGAPPTLLLPAYWETTRNLDQEDSPALEHALRHLPRLDVASQRRLEPRAAQVAALAQPAATTPPNPAGTDADLTSPEVSILILAHNQLDLTRQCVESIARCTRVTHEVILVDNGSTDGTWTWMSELAARQPQVRAIRNVTNRGFAAGNNQALSVARGRHVLLLNNDTVVTEGWLDRLLDALAKHPEAGLAGPRSNRVVGPQWVEHPGYESLDQLPAFAAEWARRNAGQSRPTGRLIGFCLLARREVVQKIGGLDERFGSGNFEDDDFSLRARLAGFGARVVDDAFVHHIGGQTFQAAKIDYREAMLRNWSLFKAKWGIDPAAPIERGYRLPQSLPAAESLHFGLPDLHTTHELSADEHTWQDRAHFSAQPKPATTPATTGPAPTRTGALALPPCALRGHLGRARELLAASQQREAWLATTQALEQRPFHPEAVLLLSEIAESAGDITTARLCAQRACDLAPDWKPARKALKKIQRLGKPTRPGWLVVPPSATPSAVAATPRLSVCLIVRNEERFIERCLASIKPLAHQIVVVDTGSTDRTVEIAQSFGAEIHTFEWCDDFSAARNVALAHATGDWVLSLDADEELPPEEHARLVAAMNKDRVLGLRLPLVNVGLEAEGLSYVPRLFRNAPGLFWVSRVHEQIFSSVMVRAEEWGMEVALGQPQLRHHGYSREVVENRQKIDRNLRLLRLAVEEHAGDPNLLMNLGLELVRSGNLEEGLDRYQDAFRALSALPAAQVTPEIRETLLTQYAAYLIRAQRHPQVIEVLRSPAAGVRPLTASQEFTLGLALMRTQKPAEAAQAFQRCLATRHLATLSPINPEIHKAGPHHCLASCLSSIGQTDAALAALRTALEADPKSRPVRLDLARLHVTQGRPVDALTALHELVAENAEDVDPWRFGAEVALSNPEFLEFALDWTGESVKHHATDARLIHQRAEALMRSGDAAAALSWFDRLAHLDHPSLLASRCLCQLVVQGKPSALPAEKEGAVSSEFLRLYQRLITTPASGFLHQVNERLDPLARVLPSAARTLSAAMAEAA